jgi:hypothetical protein
MIPTSLKSSKTRREREMFFPSKCDFGTYFGGIGYISIFI